MSVHKNDMFIKTGNSKTVTVEVVFDVGLGTSEADILRNAAQAATRLADVGNLNTWARKVTIK